MTFLKYVTTVELLLWGIVIFSFCTTFFSFMTSALGLFPPVLLLFSQFYWLQCYWATMQNERSVIPYEVLKVYILSSRTYFRDIFFKYIPTSLLNFNFTCFQGWFLSNLHTVCPGFCCFKNFLVLPQKRRASQSWITRKVSHPKGSIQVPIPALTGVSNLLLFNYLIPITFRL